MPIYRSSEACEICEDEFYNHPAPLAGRTDNVDFKDLFICRFFIYLFFAGKLCIY